ncbi:DegT/DnrJ/EryC1/StrS family aminotransferase [Cohnella silvisoli]|uniref:DegT/DnrJ/EryC1/StrS family aminotransferase n=1 Tax=Cohnella silvisoli TaxID=2873699 RepID=A0ABV1KTD3_9BACL|nr:DegT/DnrJ/EryC1/StrS family aminotransferase [Cohnella silvisoli]MCD9022432.1 DegT/DnrJ/EryC1/StrS family aminotransferase [Cohnella silvisoli]
MIEKLEADEELRARNVEFGEWPIYGQLELQLLREVLESGKWGGAGHANTPDYKPKLPEMERRFADLHSAKHSVSVVNGTVAITVALQAVGVRPGDEVIVPPYTFIATASAALAFGAIPVFVDIEEDTLAIDPDKVEKAITPKTKAIVAVHIGGAPSNLTRLSEIARKHHLALIEDAAQAVGASWEGQGVGVIGDIGTFSLQSSKNLNCGEGGIILTNNQDYYEKAWSICNVGRVPNGAWYQHENLGQNYRMTEFQAAVALAQMTRLEEQMRRREANAALLNRLLGEIEGIRLLKQDPRITRHAYHLYMFKLDSRLAERIDKQDFIHKVTAEGVPILPGYVPLNRNRAIIDSIRDWTGETRVDDCPVCERLSEREVLWITQSMLLADETSMNHIAHALQKVIRSCGFSK